MLINTNGYFISEGIPWEDWQSGHKFEGINYKVYYFGKDRKFYSHTAKSRDINVEVFKEKKSYRDYQINENTVELLKLRNNPTTKEIILTILSPEILLDEDLKEYQFVAAKIEI